MTGFGHIGGFLGATALGLCVTVASCGGGSATPGDGGAGKTGSAGTGTSGTNGTAGTTGTAGAGAPGSAKQACMSIAAMICSRDNTCNAGGATAAQVEMCTTANQVALGCDRAASAGFLDCAMDVQTLSCASLFPAPDHFFAQPLSCDDPIAKTPLSDPQMTCRDIAKTYCDRVFVCMNVAAPDPTDAQDCLNFYFSRFDCLYAMGMGSAASVTQCKADIGKIPCATPDGGATDAGADGGMGSTSCKEALVYVP
jgi:hypothetical protein